MRSGRSGVLVAGAVAVALLASMTSAAAEPHPQAAVTALAGATFVPVTPLRLLDTRTDNHQIPAKTGESLTIPANAVPADATAVVLNVTGTNSTAGTFLSVSPIGDYASGTSNLNLAAGETRANLVTVRISAGGVMLTAGPAALDAIVDLEGYYTPDAGDGFTSLAPTRLLDTRDGTGALGAGKTMVLDVSSVVPAGATAAVFNLTAVNPTVDSYVTAWPDGVARPLASNLNLAAGKVTPNLVTVAISADRKVDLYNNSGSVDLVADLAGYYSPDSTQVFYPLSPLRTLDSRDASGKPLTPLGPKGSRVLGLGGWLPANASSAVLNLTGVNVTASTFLTAWPDGQQRPTASNLNLIPGQTSANLAVVALGTGEAIDLYNLNGQVDTIVDLSGYFAPQLARCTGDCVYGWGTNTRGRLGNGTSSDPVRTPSPAYGLSGVTQLSGDTYNGYALTSDGTVWAWGQNAGGQLGNGQYGTATVLPAYEAQGYYSTVPVRVTGLTNITAISDGYALRSDGTVWSWGTNYMWRLGDGDTGDTAIAATPVQVSGLTGVVAIAGNLGNGYALKSDGTVWSWGQNVEGELGDGTTGSDATCSADEGISPDGPNCASAVPVRVSGLTGVTHIGSGVAVTPDGTVWRWGSNQSDVPTQVSGLSNVTAFAAAASGTDYALRSDGTVWSWGDNYNGSFGNGSTCDDCYSGVPVQVSGLTATAIAAGEVGGYALRSDGTVWAWGGGQDGVLGNGDQFAQSAVPVQVPGLSGVSAIGDYGYAVVS